MITREDAALAYVQFEILSYLDASERPCDTIEGILEWWVYRQRIVSGPKMVRTAVDRLVVDGQLFERKRIGASPLYAASPDAFPPSPPSAQP